MTTNTDLHGAMPELPETFTLQVETGGGAVNAAIREAGDRLAKLHRMINHAYPIIKAQHGAEHMLDGFKPKKRAIDALLADFESELVAAAQTKSTDGGEG